MLLFCFALQSCDGDIFCRYKLVALHSILSSQDQAAAFTVPPAGVRKVLHASCASDQGLWLTWVNVPRVCFRLFCLQTSLRPESPFQMWCSSSTRGKLKKIGKGAHH